MKRRSFIYVLACIWLAACAQAVRDDTGKPSAKAPPPVERPELERFFGGAEGTFVMYDTERRLHVRYNALRAVYRFLPGATFAIPLTLIAVETGVASDADFPLPWYDVRDPRQAWWPEAWARDHTLRTAFSNSVVWFYQELARRVGTNRMRTYVERLGYGNSDIEGEIDRFWRNGRLRISAEQQVDFLRRFYFEQFEITPQATHLVKDLMVLEETPAYRLSGATEWFGLADPLASQVGWSVGYLERDGNVYVFALNVDIEEHETAVSPLELTKDILRHFGML